MRSSGNAYFTRLDHLRFMAALLVLVWHAFHHAGVVPFAYVPKVFVFSLFEEGHTGVAMFMVLSGFIFQQLCRGREVIYGAFIRNRLLRIAPLFVVWTLFFYYGSDIDPVRLLVSTLALLNKDTVPSVGWTIIVEFQFYLLFPVLLAFGARYGLRYFAALIALAIAFRFMAWGEFGSAQVLGYWTLFGRIDQFLCGMIACELMHRHPRVAGHPAVFAGVLLAGLALYHLFNRLGGYDNLGGTGYPSRSLAWIVIPTLEGLFYGALTASYLKLAVRIPALLDRAVAYLGSLSYSMYWSHLLVVEGAGRLLGRLDLAPHDVPSAAFFALGIVLPCTLAISAVTYALIEAPFLKLRGTYLRDLPARA